MQDSIFTKIIKGEIPSHKVHDDEQTLAFMDISPIQPGMVIVVSKKQIDHIWDLSQEDYQALMKTVHLVGQRLRKVFPGKARVAVIIEGFEVPHAHVKVFPVNNEQEVRTSPSHAEPDHSALAEMAEKLAF
ncbi:MAG TPA: HIT family protein [Candidatus Saccharimonadales bacterium]|nr:HIT family protein [Candidatus Saccharimonadales bacterium]